MTSVTADTVGSELHDGVHLISGADPEVDDGMIPPLIWQHDGERW